MRFGTKTLTDIRGIWATGCSIRQQVLPMVWLMALLFAGSTAVPVCAADESPLAQAIMADGSGETISMVAPEKPVSAMARAFASPINTWSGVKRARKSSADTHVPAPSAMPFASKMRM